jgi:GAF domain-containing protein
MPNKAIASEETLYEVGSLIIEAQDPEQVLLAVLEYARHLDLGVGHDLDRCLIALLEDPDASPARRLVEVRAVWDRQGEEASFLGNRFSPTEIPLVGEMGPEDRVLVDDFATSDGVDEKTRATFQQLGVGGAAILPLAVGERLLGWLLAETVGRAGRFPDDQVEALQFIVDQAAVVLQNLRFGEESRRRVVQLQAAAEISGAASSILDLEELLSMAVELINDRFDLYYTGIFLVDNEGLYADLRAGTGQAGLKMVQDGYRLEVGGESMIGWCVANAQARIALDVGQDAVRFDNPLLPETRSEMALPLAARDRRRQAPEPLAVEPESGAGRVVGAMTIQSNKPAAFREEDVIVLQIMADQLANAIVNARLFEERERRITELAIVNEIGTTLAQAFRLEDLFEMVHSQVGRLFDADNFYIATYEEGSDQWTSAFHLEDGERQAAAEYGIEAGLTGYIIRSREPVLLRSVQQNAAFHEEQGIQYVGERARSWLGVPLVTADKLVGVMGIQDYNQEGLYDRSDLALFSTIGTQVAGALDNVRLLEETGRRAQEMEVLNEVGRAAASVLDPDEVLRQLMEVTKERFGHYFVSVALVEDGHIVFQHGSAIGSASEAKDPEWLKGAVVDLGTGQGLIVEAVKTGQPVLVNDVLADARYLEVEALPDTRAELAVPIKVKGRVIGVLDVQSDRQSAYDASDVALLEALADQAAVAIENAQLFEAERVAREQAERLHAATQSISLTRDLDQVLASILGELRKVVPYDTASVQQLRGNRMEIIGGHGFPSWEGIRGLSFDLSASDNPNQVVVETQAPVIVDDGPVEYEAFRHDPHAAAGIRSWLGVPMRFGNRLLGLIGLDKREAGFYSPEDARVAQAFAIQAANAVENAHLLEDARQHAEEMRILHQISLELAQEQQDMDVVLDTITRRTMELLDSDGGGVWLWRPEIKPHGELELAITYQVGEIDFGGRRLAPGEGLTGRAFAEKKIQVVNDYRVWDEKPLVFEDAPFVSGMAVPMTWQAKIVGVLVATRSQEGRPYREAEQDLAELLAGQAAAVIESARLFDETQQRLEELTVLAGASQSLASAPFLPEEIANLLARQFTSLLDVRETSVSILEPEKGWLRIVADIEVEDGVSKPYHEMVGTIMRLDEYPATAKVLESQQPLVVQASDPDADPAELAYMREYNVQTLAILPLVAKGESIGVLELEVETQERQFTAQELELVMTMANQAAVALDNARLLEETQQRLEELTALAGASQSLASAPFLPEEIANLLAHQFTSLLDVRETSVSILEPEKGWLRTVADIEVEDGVGKPYHEMVGTIWRLDEYPATAKVLESQQPLVVQASDPDADPAELAYLREWNLQTMAIIPLVAKGESIGVVELEVETQERQFAAQELELVMTMANQAAVALDNARLLEETQARAEQMAVVNEVAQAIASVLDLDQVLLQIVDTIKERLGLFYVGIFLLDNAQLVYRCGSLVGDTATRLEQLWEQSDIRLDLNGTGLTVTVANRGEPILVNDVRQEPRYMLVEGLEPVRSELDMPIMSKGRLVGVLTVQSDQVNAFESEDQALLEALASHAGAAIDNARLFAETEVMLSETETLYNASRLLASASNLEEIVAAVAEGTYVVALSRAVLWNLERDATGEIQAVIATASWYGGEGSPPPQVGTRIPFERAPAGHLALTPVPQFIEDVDQDERIDPAGRRLLQEEDIRALAILPLWTGRRQVGYMTLIAQTPYHFTTQDIRRYRSLAGQVAVVVENRRLLNQTRRQLADLGTIQTAMAQLTAAPTFDEALGVLLPHVADVVEAETASLYLLDREHLVRAGAYSKVRRDDLPIGEALALSDYPLTRQVVETRRPLTVMSDDPQLQEHARRAMAVAGVKATATVPVVGREGVLGTLSLHRLELSRGFGSYELGLVETLANQAATTLEKIRLMEQIQARAEELAVLNEMSSVVLASLDPGEVMEGVFHSVSQLMDTTNFYIARYDPESDEVSFPFAVEKGVRVQWASRRSGAGLTEHVLHAGEAVLIKEDVAAALEALGLDVIGEMAVSWLGVPFWLGERVLGIIAVQSYEPGIYFEERHRDLLITVANQAALALENARLFEETEGALAETEALYHAGADLTTAETYHDILMVLRRHTILGEADCSASLSLFDRPWQEGAPPEWIMAIAAWRREGVEQPSRFATHDYPSVWQLLRFDAPTTIVDIEEEARMDDRARALYLEKFGARSTIAVPLVVGGRWLGYVDGLYSEPTEFTEGQVRRLMALAGQAAIAVQGLRQLEQIEARARRERTLREITTRVRASMDPEVIMRTAARELGTALGRPAFVRLGAAEELERGAGDSEGRKEAEKAPGARRSRSGNGSPDGAQERGQEGGE